jgi:hypothetical protein
MAPKSAMKTAAMKAVAATSSKASTKKAMKATANIKPVKKDKLTKASLKKLGTESLDQKVKRAVEETSSPEEAADALKASLSKIEHSKIWGQHNTFLKNNPDAATIADGSKKDKGLAAALWYIQSKGNRFLNLSQTIGGSVAVKKLDKWCSEKEMIDKFGQTDFEAHCASGRIIWRECQMTRGTFEYKDQNAIERETTTMRGKTLTRGQEAPLDDDIDQMFEDLYNQDFRMFEKIFVHKSFSNFLS